MPTRPSLHPHSSPCGRWRAVVVAKWRWEEEGLQQQVGDQAVEKQIKGGSGRQRQEPRRQALSTHTVVPSHLTDEIKLKSKLTKISKTAKH